MDTRSSGDLVVNSSSIQPSRRDFLGAASTLAIAAAATAGTTARADEAASEPEKLLNLLPTVQLGSHRVTRLILGGNPVYGHSHFNRLYSQHLVNYHTPERVVELLRACAAAGINTWQNSYSERTVADVHRCRREGVPFHWLLLGKPDWVERPAVIEEAARHQPIGIAPHGSSAERLHRAGQLDVLQDLLKRIRQTGVLVGLSAHNPEIIEIADREEWDVDYYMCCLYYHNRPAAEFKRLLGEAPMGEVYLASDRERMLKVVASVRKPCLVYKVLAAGRADLSPRGIRQAFEVALGGMKPADAMIVGMFQEFGDQVAQNARLARELCGRA
ncbi:MAG TPA: hypothetical protein VML55_17615 [Planctomycetaceae bacterium]|nr:hypothetical protein [Planctomycetaceae bacterium]